MRNLKKLFAVVVVIAVMLTTMIPAAFAEGTTSISADAQACATLGMLQGDGNGVTYAYTQTQPARIQAAIMLLRLKGLEAAAQATPVTADNFSDVTAAWQKPFTAYLKAHPELGFAGIGNNKFDPNSLIDAKQYYSVMLTVLGYSGDYTWATVMSKAAQVGLTKNLDITKLTVNDMAVATVEALNAKVKGSDESLVATLAKADAAFAAKATAAGFAITPANLAVKSIKAINAKQLEITYNKAVDPTSAKFLGNYYIQLNGDASAATVPTKDAQATLALDSTNKVVTITFGDAVAGADINTEIGGINAGTPFNFIIKGVKDAAGTVMPDYTATISVNDTTAPSVVSVTAAAKTTTNTATIKFSEPVKLLGTIVYINGQAAVPQAGSTWSELTVTSAQALVPGTTYDVTVLNTQDFGSNYISPNPTTAKLTVTGDTTAPNNNGLTIKSDNVISLTFDKDMDVNTFIGNARLVDSNGVAYGAAITPSYPDGSNKKVIDLTLTHATPLVFNTANVYTGTLYLASTIADVYGNTIAATSKAVTINKDTAAPTLASVKYVAPGSLYTNGVVYTYGAIVAKYSEAVTYNAGTPTFINANGVLTSPALLAIVSNVNDATEIIIPVNTAAMSAGNYTIMIPANFAQDGSFAYNKSAAVTNTFAASNTGDSTKPVIVTTLGAVTAATTTSSGSTIVVNFTDDIALDLTSIMNVNNYLLNGLPLPTGSYITNVPTPNADAATAVAATIHLPAGSVKTGAATNVLNVINIKDKNGNVALPVAYSAITLVDDIAPVMSSAILASNGTLVVGFSENVIAAATANLADFTLTMNGVSVNAGAAGVAAIAQGVGSDAGKYVITVNAIVDDGADTNATTTADNRLYVDVNNNATYDAGTDILVKVGTTTAVGATTLDLNSLTGLKIATIATPAVVLDLSTLGGGILLTGNTTITVK